MGPKMKNKINYNLNQLCENFDKTLILNPTENIPWKCEVDIEFIEGLYIPEDKRDKTSTIAFAGRNQMRDMMKNLCRNWEKALSAKDSSFKLYSGLHAHIVLFMSIAAIGDKVMLLPGNAGGHHATAKILKRLGLQIKEFIVNEQLFCIDISKTKALIESWKPDFIFISRSDGLYYEDFGWLQSHTKCYKIFDASQYLSHILTGDYINPFEMGMDLIITTLHKNYPGPQKASFFTKKKDEMWNLIREGVVNYVSNSHPLQIFKSALAIPEFEIMKNYSQTMLKNSITLEQNLLKNGVPVVIRNRTLVPSQQIWIPLSDKNSAYNFFKRLEQIFILTNYRKLPYNLGYGIRIGTAAATRQGLLPEDTIVIGEIIAKAYVSKHISNDLINKSECIIKTIKARANIRHFTAIQSDNI
jgi:glycine hydroxymethyltransferase